MLYNIFQVGLANKQLWIRVTAPQSMKGQVKGLFGIFDGNMDNDLTDRVGTVVLPPTANEDQIYQYGQTCEQAQPIDISLVQ